VNGNVEVALEFDGCRGAENEVVYVEHVQAVVSLTASRRGEVEIYLTSPSGTRSTLLKRRHRDTSTEGFTNWPFLTTHSWGELAAGTWRLEVRNGASFCEYSLQFVSQMS
jgi:furin